FPLAPAGRFRTAVGESPSSVYGRDRRRVVHNALRRGWKPGFARQGVFEVDDSRGLDCAGLLCLYAAPAEGVLLQRIVALFGPDLVSSVPFAVPAPDFSDVMARGSRIRRRR